MKICRDYEVLGESTELDLAAARIQAQLSRGCRRKPDSISVSDTEEIIILTVPATDKHPAASLRLLRAPQCLRIVSIGPQQDGKLSPDEYNTIVWEFDDYFVVPAIEGLSSLNVRMGRAEETLNDWMSEETAELLRIFATAANPSTGATNSHDRERWFAFIIAAHREGARLDVTQLDDWFRTETRFIDRVVTDLVVEYERSRQLLPQYDQSASQTV